MKGTAINRDRELATLRLRLAELTAALADLQAELRDVERQRTEDEARSAATVADLGNRLTYLAAERDLRGIRVTELEGELAAARSDAETQRNFLAGVYASTSWRLSAPVRGAGRVALGATRPYHAARRVLSQSARESWQRLPMADRYKQRLKTALFAALPFVFFWSRAYKDWRDYTGRTRRIPANAALVALAAGAPVHESFVPKLTALPPLRKPVRLICFYLPQFHPIPENDAWWGEGFTEWTNVRPAQPQFIGHYQPRVPGELGYYDLRDTEVQRRQIALAKLYGIEGFCFYLYWFGGKRLLEKPLDNYLADATLDLPFCVCWANENWSRRWDGLDAEILIAQAHSPEDDIAFIADAARYLRDPRYIRIDGKPVLVVYRPKLLPSAPETAARWRAWCRSNGVGEIFLAYTQSFEKTPPADYGFDAAIEFPPNNSSPPNVTDSVQPLREDFAAMVYDWRVFVERSRVLADPGYPLFRSVTPQWDNTARRKHKAGIFIHNTPQAYGEWLRNAIADTRARFARADERLLFVNAWNEWAEGAYLEPDARNGYAYLDETRKALEAVARPAGPARVVVISHDAHAHGAQLLALHLCRVLRRLGLEADLVVLGGGPLLGRFAEVAQVHRMDLAADDPQALAARLEAFRHAGADLAIVNTAVSGRLVPPLKAAGFRVVSLIHEMPGILASYGLAEPAKAIVEGADRVIFPAELVKDSFETFIGGPVEQAVIRPQGTYQRTGVRSAAEREDTRRSVRLALGVPPDARIILGVGYADLRKGFDLFVEAAIGALARDASAVAVWVGNRHEPLFREQVERIATAGLSDRFRFTGAVDRPQSHYIAADVYVLSSREDPFPSVLLEALDAGVPVIAFRGAGGFAGLIDRDCGVLVPLEDAGAMADAIVALLADRERAIRLGSNGAAIVQREFQFEHYVRDLLTLGGQPLPRVSVVVPNYNYARYLQLRLDSIARQTLRPYEIIILDDASTDHSMAEIETWIRHSTIPTTVIANAANSGSVSQQWIRGVAAARGDFVWIAEADDAADPELLESLLPAFDRADVVLSYSQSRQIDGEGRVLANDYLGYVADLGRARWTAPYLVDGRTEIAEALFLKNTIPNVSAVVFRRDALQQVLEANASEIGALKHAGDWLTYLRLLETGAVAFSPRALNAHRRHQGSVTLAHNDLRHLSEIIRLQRDTIRRFGLGAAAVLAADAYAQRIYEQFALATPEHPRFTDHPGLAEALAA